jgi:TetR/AcrR family transcriptional repressor of mexJK operon
MDAVAADAGVSKQTVFGHFGSKEGLFKSVIDGARAQAPAPPTVADSDRLLDPEDLAGSLAKVGRTLMRVVFDPRIAALRRLLIAEAPRRPDLRKAWTDGAPKAFNEGLTRELGELSRAGRLDISDPALATRQLIGLWVYPRNVISAYGSESVSEDEENAIIREAVMFFLKAYERPKRDY